MKTQLFLVIGLLTLAGASALVSGCTKAHAVEARPPRPVKVQSPAPAPRRSAIRYSASIEPLQQVTLSFKASGYVDTVVRRRGADGAPRTIQAGDLVTRGALVARIDAADYRARLAQARARVVEAEAAQTRARLDLERARTLFASESLVKPDLDAAQAAFDAAQARVTAGRAELELASNALRDCALVAPAAGVLLERRIEVGTLVGAGSVGFLLGDLSAVKARFGIPDAMIPSVRLGARMTAAGVGPAGTALTVPLGAVVRSSDSGGANGAPRYALLVVERQGAVDVARTRPIELGEVMGNGVVVTRGLTPGDRVIVTAANLLTDGDPVRVIP